MSDAYSGWLSIAKAVKTVAMISFPTAIIAAPIKGEMVQLFSFTLFK